MKLGEPSLRSSSSSHFQPSLAIASATASKTVRAAAATPNLSLMHLLRSQDEFQGNFSYVQGASRASTRVQRQLRIGIFTINYNGIRCRDAPPRS